MDNHPTVAELEGLVFGGNPTGRTRAVIAHLLRGCGVCSALLAPYFPFLFDRKERRRGAPPAPLEIYDGAMDRAFAAVKRTGAVLPPRRRTPEEIKRQALELLAAGGLDALGNAPLDIQGVPLCEALLEQSWALRHQSPPEMAQLAQAAVLVADRLNDPGLGPGEVIHLRCRAWTELGNARRVNDELDRAAEALGRAAELVRAGGDALLTARFFTVLASFYGARRHFELALATFDAAADVYRQHGDGHMVGRTLIMKGIFTGYSGDAEEAVRLLQEGLASVDEKRDPGLVFAALQSTGWFLVDCGRFREAWRVLWEVRRRRLDAGGRVNELKVRWLEGHILSGEGKLARAELALKEVKQGFEEEVLRYKPALVGLELGAVWLRQGRNAEAAGVVLSSTEVFLSLRIEREVLASILVLQKAAAGNRLTLGLLNPIIERLRQSDRD